MADGTSERAAQRPEPGVPDDLVPGGARAKARGCLCSVLANAAYRSGSVEDPCIDPRCPMHADPGGVA
ncbi:hypothetical protein [Pseudonocardia parietis]|uniref:Uncharacterized protein n=1 Tax=Pseudonocardia parietis TaxID=570936 RepID=A0ABS4VKI6_9PSEU|nr:hypothetical protein [Pseudonocardia parietis]MBP2364438.1 hypothetical protein [Pseudonocardia parietis]